MDAARLAEVVSGTAPPPGWWVVLITAVLGAAIAITSTHAEKINVISVIVHEAGHAAAAIITGGGVYRIELQGHYGGVTGGWYYGRLAKTITSFAGYVAPALAGLGLAHLISRGHVSAVLALTVALAVLVLLVARDLFTIAALLAVGAIAAGLLWWTPLWLHVWLAYLETWVLLLGGTMHLIDLTIERYRDGRAVPSDAESLAKESGLPVPVWLLLWLTIIGWCLWNAIPLLWPQ